MIDALLSALALKDERRTGWVLRGVSDPETVAAHTWGVALLCLVYGDEAGVDVDRAVRMALVHDLAEAETGDLPARADTAADAVDPAERRARERAAMERFDRDLPVLDLWDAYEDRGSSEAAFVGDMDLIDMCVQALYYERGGRYDPGESDESGSSDRLDEFFATAEPRLRTGVGRRLFGEVRERYERAKSRS